MTFLNAWVLFGLLPLYLLYRKHHATQKTRQLHLLYLALAFMLLALSRPAFKSGFVDETFDSQDYIIAIDASYSMQATDIKPTRYAAAVAAIKQLVAQHPKDRFTLFAFTSNALLISPPTTDTRISMQALDALNPEYILTKSTSLYHLFETIAKVSFKKKKLIIFSDGGDEQDLAELLDLAKKHNIVAYIVATATPQGAALKKDGSYIKRSDSALVISKINPILQPLAEKSGGRYFAFASDVASELSDAVTTAEESKPETIKVQSYNELFYVPLFIALLLFFLAVTKLHQLFLLIPFMLVPVKSDAGILDFYYLNRAYQDYDHSRFEAAAEMFEKTSPSVGSYYNIATAWYKAGRYKKALEYYAQIRTPDKKLKQRIYYNMGNCAVKLRRYDHAETYYVQALALGEDADALFNLMLLRRLHLKTPKDVQQMMPSKKTTKQEERSKTGTTKQDEEKSGGGKKSSNQDSAQSTSGQGEGKKQKKAAAKSATRQQSNYKMGYKAYERINKGYADEKEPW